MNLEILVNMFFFYILILVNLGILIDLVTLARYQYGDSGDCVFSGDSGIYGYFGKSNNFGNVVFLVNLVNLVF